MSRKPTSAARKLDANQFTATATKTAAKAVAAGVPVSTPVRNTPIPKPVAAKPTATATATATATREAIARKAFELYAGGSAGGEMDHWFAAERLLRAA